MRLRSDVKSQRRICHKRMKKAVLFVFTLLFCVIFPLFSVGCQPAEKSGYNIAIKDVDYLEDIRKNGSLYFEWLHQFDPLKPSLIIFPGEEKENELFSMNLPRKVYTRDVLCDSFGYLGKGLLTDSAQNYFDLSYYWQKIAGYNVAVFHWEKFVYGENLQTNVGKIYTTYNMRYTFDGQTESNAVPSYPLAAVAAVSYLNELQSKQANSNEIRIVGNGIGAVLAHATSAYLANYYKDSPYMPYRLTLCDMPYPDMTVSYQIDWLGTKSDTSFSDILILSDQSIIKSGTALEIIYTKENGATSYPYENIDEKGFSEFRRDGAYLELNESYSLNQSFDLYKSQKRIALDWYLYSVLGSDDLSVGYPSQLNSAISTTMLSEKNWGNNNTRPILNNRMIRNDEPSGIGRIRGFSFGVSAWTPTVYIRALRGRIFTQKKALNCIGQDENGLNKYNYSRYVLTKFSSENYQVSDSTDTVICGYVYIDNNRDSVINDGVGKGINAELILSVFVEEKAVLQNVKIETDDDGFYSVVLSGGSSEIGVTNRKKGRCDINGVVCVQNEYRFELSLILTKKYTTKDETMIGGLNYNQISGNNFDKKATCYVNGNTAGTVMIRNCLLSEVEK